MRNPISAWALPILIVLASCASPDPSYYTLAPIRGTAMPGAPALVELRRPGIAGYLDRSEITRSNTPYQLKVAAGERWGEPFGDMVGRVLAEDLNSRLERTSVFTSAGAISADAGARVEIDIQRFDADAGGQLILAAQVAITRNGNRAEPITRPHSRRHYTGQRRDRQLRRRNEPSPGRSLQPDRDGPATMT